MSVIRAADVIPRRIPMIWRGRIPVFGLTVIAGKPGLGKSTLGTAIAAELSISGLTGAISNVEDDVPGVIVPRLAVAQASMERVLVIPEETAPVLPRDFDRLEQLVAEHDLDYLMLDPAAAHFSPERRIHDRPTLRQLAAIGRRNRCAIILFHHTVKTVKADAIDLLGGPSGGLGGTARAVYFFGYDPDDEDQRALSTAKINGIDRPATLIIRHETVEYNSEHGPIEAGLLSAVSTSGAEARDVLRKGRRNVRRDRECLEWLTLFLAKGDDHSQQAKAIKREGAAAGFGWQTLLRVGQQLKVDHVRHGFGGDGFWTWGLPGGHPLREPQDQEAQAA